MADPSIAEATKPYLDYLDREITLSGVWAAFCVVAAATAFDRVLGVKTETASDFVAAIQAVSYLYVLSAIAALLIAAFFFELQRRDLVWLHGRISYAVTCKMSRIRIPKDTFSLDEGISFGNTYSLWNRYRFGLTFLAVAVVEVGLSLCFAIPVMIPAATPHHAVLYLAISSKSIAIALAPFIIAAVSDFGFFIWAKNQDSKS